jgi:uncharacterized protein (TIGR00730 family)
MGKLLAGRGIQVVYGGGHVGLMGVVADAALESGGNVVGVIPRALADRELAHGEVTKMHVVDSMHDRKAMMADLSDGFVALPGGYGTFEELCEIITWSQLGIHQKPCGVLNVNGYYDPLLTQFDAAVEEGFMPAEHRRLVLSDDDPESLLDQLSGAEPPPVEKWIDSSET